MSRSDYFLKKNLGEDFFEALSKVELWKPGTKTTLDHEEMKTALQIVPRAVIALLIKELVPMNIGENREIELFGIASPGPHPHDGRAILRATKHERDVYSGEIEEDNKKVVEFKFRSLPGVGLVIMSAFELYDMDNLLNSQTANEVAQAPIVAPLPPPPSMVEDADIKIQQLIDERLALHELIGKVVDKRIMEKEAIHELVLSKLTEALKLVNEKVNKVSQEVKIAVQVASAPKISISDPASKTRPLKEFLEKRKKKEFSVQMAKGESFHCPDCGKNIFDGKVFSGCICYGDCGKVFLKKTENGMKVRFGKGWDEENIEMLLEVLQRKNK